jgi:signal transduction histidine kinase
VDRVLILTADPALAAALGDGVRRAGALPVGLVDSETVFGGRPPTEPPLLSFEDRRSEAPREDPIGPLPRERIAFRSADQPFELSESFAEVIPIDRCLVGLTGLAARRVEAARDRLALESRAGALALGEVMAGVLHELKNPVNNIASGVERLQSLPGADDPVWSKWLDLVGRNAELLRHAVTSLLGGLRDGGPMRDLDLREVLDQAAEFAFKGDPDTRSIEVVREFSTDPCPVVGRAGELTHLFLNLLINARQAIGAGEAGRVTLRCRPGGVEIEDTGPGIPEDIRERLFSSRVTTKTGGTGIGLMLVRRIAERHGARVRAENGKRSGARFRVDFPR